MGITYNKYPYEGKVVIVTGCARGIGRAIARAFGENGATVIGVDLNLEGVQETLAPFENSLALSVNIADEESCKGLIETVIERYGKLDVLMNNAGIFTQAPVTESAATTCPMPTTPPSTPWWAWYAASASTTAPRACASTPWPRP